MSERLRRILALAGPTDSARLKASLERARALPSDGRRHIVVDIASAQLWMVEQGRVIDRMRVIVGKPGMPTPSLAGFIRFAVRNPYWNLPPDLVRDRARHVAAGDIDLIRRERLELLSDWSASPPRLDPAEVDWTAVAAGAVKLRMRQSPGADNMMGAVKFMLPNRLGIYLHDTPDKGTFARADRRLSSGRDAARALAVRRQPARGDRASRSPRRSARAVPVYILQLDGLTA